MLVSAAHGRINRGFEKTTMIIFTGEFLDYLVNVGITSQGQSQEQMSSHQPLARYPPPKRTNGRGCPNGNVCHGSTLRLDDPYIPYMYSRCVIDRYGTPVHQRRQHVSCHCRQPTKPSLLLCGHVTVLTTFDSCCSSFCSGPAYLPSCPLAAVRDKTFTVAYIHNYEM
jgi:hypothetical protein